MVLWYRSEYFWQAVCKIYINRDEVIAAARYWSQMENRRYLDAKAQKVLPIF